MKKFFETIEPLKDSKMMPVWNGELYLEYHRGTYTTQARNKRANRKSEFLLHDAEFLCTYASLITNYQYPITAFQNAWRTVCLNQFHDIIPGSSIGPVYEESQQQYAQLMQDVSKFREEALAGDRRAAGCRHSPCQRDLVCTEWFGPDPGRLTPSASRGTASCSPFNQRIQVCGWMQVSSRHTA